MKCTLYLWHAHLLHGAGDTPPLTPGYILQQSAVVLNDGLPDLCNSHSEGCKVAVETKTTKSSTELKLTNKELPKTKQQQ